MRSFCISCAILLLTLTGGAQQRTASLDLREHPMGAALDSLSVRYGVPIIYRERDVRGIRVTVACRDCRFADALAAVLRDAPLEAVVSGTQVILRPRLPVVEVHSSIIAGTVMDSAAGGPLRSAIVTLRSGERGAESTGVRWVATNPFGFYALRGVTGGSYTMQVRSVGYHAWDTTITVEGTSAMRLDVALRQGFIPLEELTVEGQRMTSVPAAGIAHGLYMRSTPLDQNEYLLDGARIYNPAHYGGVLSTFHPETLGDVEISTAGLSPAYGGRIGGYLDFALREGSRERISGTAGTGSLGVHASVEGPVTGNATFLLSARRGFPDIAVPDLRSYGIPGRLGSGELIGKLTWRMSSSTRLSLSAYTGADHFTNEVSTGNRSLGNAFDWGNTSVTTRFNAIMSPSVFLHASAVYTRYVLSLHHTPGGAWAQGLIPADSRYAIEDLGVKVLAEHYLHEDHTLHGGMELTRHAIDGSIASFATRVAGWESPNRQFLDLAVYLQDHWRLGNGAEIQFGGRVTAFTGPGTTASAFDPRFSLLVPLREDTRTYLAVTSISQFLHPYRASGIFRFYPTPFWYPSDADVPPTQALQITTGVRHDIDGVGTGVGVEAFYRAAHRTHAVTRAALPDDEGLASRIIAGTATTAGFDVSFRHRTASFNASASYTFAWADHRFPDGSPADLLVPQKGQRHEVHLATAYRPDDAWVFSIMAVIGFGGEPLQTMDGSAVSLETPDRTFMDLLDGGGFLDVNGARYPGFQRLEVSTGYHFEVAGLPARVTLQLINGYGLLDPIAWDLVPSGDPRNQWRARVREIDLFPLFPVLGVSVRF